MQIMLHPLIELLLLIFIFTNASQAIGLMMMYWFSVNWKFPMSELTYSAKGDFDEKEALQLSA